MKKKHTRSQHRQVLDASGRLIWAWSSPLSFMMNVSSYRMKTKPRLLLALLAVAAGLAVAQITPLKAAVSFRGGASFIEGMARPWRRMRGGAG